MLAWFSEFSDQQRNMMLMKLLVSAEIAVGFLVTHVCLYSILDNTVNLTCVGEV